MDHHHYKVLGISSNSSKDEIKEAYRKLAMQFHPDKHAHSSKNLKEAATLKFKLISQAYETLIKSPNQNHTHNNYNQTYNHNKNYNYNYNNNYNNNYNSSGYGYGYSGSAKRGGGLKMEIFFSYLTTKGFLLNAAFVGLLLAGSTVISSGGHTLWEMQNSGKSFEDAMESIQKAKKFKDKT